MLPCNGHAPHCPVLCYLTPVVTLGVEWLIFRVSPDGLSLVGAAAACLGVWLVTRQAIAPGKPKSA